MSNLKGLIIRSQSGFFTVQTECGPLVCKLRGRLKKSARHGDLVAIGDRVEVSPLDETTGMIESVAPRRSMISRRTPTSRESTLSEYQQIIMANVDQAVFVFACARPEPHLRMLDRFLVIAEKQEIPAVVVANKLDLVDMDQAQDLFGPYAAIGYPVIYTSVVTGAGLKELHEQLTGVISALSGPSGVGKSSLLNAIQPGLGLAIHKVSQTTGKGQHTTVLSEMFALEHGGYVADTPGLKSLALWDIKPEEVDGYFPELKALVADCQFNDCTHLHEPGCAVRQAVLSGLVHPERYTSYVHLRCGEE